MSLSGQYARLNVTILKANLVISPPKNITNVWFVISVDKAGIPLSTLPLNFHSKMSFDYQLQFTFPYPDLNSTYMYINLCHNPPNSKTIQKLAISRVRLSNIPRSGEIFLLPLYSKLAPGQQFAEVEMKVNLILIPPPALASPSPYSFLMPQPYQ